MRLVFCFDRTWSEEMEELGLKSGSPNAQSLLVLAKLDQVWAIQMDSLSVPPCGSTVGTGRSRSLGRFSVTSAQHD